ncbi:cytochrome P450, partial [Streptomyces wedmorensis]
MSDEPNRGIGKDLPERAGAPRAGASDDPWTRIPSMAPAAPSAARPDVPPAGPRAGGRLRTPASGTVPG